MGDGNSFPLVVCVFQVILAYERIVLCMCSGNVLLDSGSLGKHAPNRCLTPERESTSHRPMIAREVEQKLKRSHRLVSRKPSQNPD